MNPFQIPQYEWEQLKREVREVQANQYLIIEHLGLRLERVHAVEAHTRLVKVTVGADAK